LQKKYFFVGFYVTIFNGINFLSIEWSVIMLKKISIILFVTLILTISIWGCTNVSEEPLNVSEEPLSKTGYDMLGTVVTIKLYDHKDSKILDMVFDRIEEIENRMSVNIEDSDISKINKNAGKEAVVVHDDVYDVLKKAKYYAEISNSAFEPTIGPLVQLWGIGKEGERIPEDDEIKNLLSKVDYRKLELLDDNKVFLRDEGMAIDLGGIAKGYAADEVNRILEENKVKSAIIDLGGNIYVKGNKLDGNKWRVGIQDPFEVRNANVGIISTLNKSVVTSGNYERYFEEDGVRYHHILDIQTGYPARNEVAGISIIADKSMDADALSTALFVLGVEKGLELVEKIDGIDAIFITKNYEVYKSSGIKEDFIIDNEKFTLNRP